MCNIDLAFYSLVIYDVESKSKKIMTKQEYINCIDLS